MVELHEETLRELEHEGDSLLFRETIGLIERSHPEDGPGVARETLDAYAEALEAERDMQFDAASFRERVDAALTDADTWVDTEHLYELGDGRVSRYPASWHERLGGSVDVRRYLEFILEEVPGFKEDIGRGGAGPGIPEGELIDLVATVGRVDREEAISALREQRDRGEIAEGEARSPHRVGRSCSDRTATAGVSRTSPS